MLFVEYPKCSICKKAKAWLDEHNLDYEDRNIKEENPTQEELNEWYKQSGLPIKKFFNTSGVLYKQMNLKEKLADMSDDEQIKLLSTDGMLVKRPIVLKGDKILVGFKERDWEELL